MHSRNRAISTAIIIYWTVFIILLSGAVVLGQSNPSDTSVVLVMDRSDSMSGSPMALSQEAATQFVNDIDGVVPISIVTFGNRASLAVDYTTDVARLETTISEITLGGVTALYDAGVLGVETAAASGAENSIVILLSDGGEFGGQSEAERGDALSLAVAEGVQIHTVGLGFSIDREYLTGLATETNGEFFEVESVTDLSSVFATLSQTVLTLNAETVTEGLAPISAANTDIGVVTDGNATTAGVIEPRNAVNIEPNAAVEDEADTATGITATDTELEETGNTIIADDIQANVVTPFGEIIPIAVEFTGEETVSSASISINDVELATFVEAPFEYSLDSEMLREGTYALLFSATTAAGLTISDTVEFEVATAESLATPTVATADNADNTGATVIDLENLGPVASAPSVTDGFIITVDGETFPLSFTFSLSEGLEQVIPAPTALQVAETQNLTDILVRPLEQIPLPVRETLTRQYPVTMAIIVLLMSIFLLPQGIFTIWWMTYTWVNADRYRKSSAPEQFVEPNYSFTALVPARKEDMVIYDTIMAVNSIRYPENLKETLVLIRDEDDDETIAETMRAIDDIKRSYERRGETYPNNVRLVTFTDGPKNKPNGLNRGYKQSTKNVLCIFDAEDQPHENIYQAVNTRMVMDGADVVQSGVQLMNFKSTWFSSFNVLEYFFWFKSGLHAYTNELHVTPLGGNTVFFKKSWMDKLAAEDTEKGYRVWDEEKLTEDADIGIRLTKMGASIQIMYEAELATREETPADVEEFIKQRTRWCQGFYEIFSDGKWLTLPKLSQRIASVYILMNSVLQALVLLFLPLGIYIGLTQQVPVLVALISWTPIYMLFLQMIITLIGMGEFANLYGMKLPLFFRLRMVMFYYPYQLLLAVSAIRAIYRFSTNQSAWEKTSHSNLHREAASTSRAA